MSRYAGEYDEEMARGRARAAESQRRYDQEQEVEYAKWRRAHAAELAEPSLYEMKGDWDFVPLREEGGRISGYKVLVNRKFVAMIIPRGNDLVVMMIDPEGGVSASYRRGGENLNAQQVMNAFMESQQRQLPGSE